MGNPAKNPESVRTHIATDIRGALMEDGARGVLLAGSGGTGLRSFFDEKVYPETDRPFAVMRAPLLPGYDLTEGLVAIIRSIAEHGLTRIARLGQKVRKGEPAPNDTDSLSYALWSAIDSADDATPEHSGGKSWMRAGAIIKNFAIAARRAEATLSFANRAEKSSKQETDTTTAAKLGGKLKVDPGNWVSALLKNLVNVSLEGELQGEYKFSQEIEDCVIDSSSWTLSPYTPAIASKTLNSLLNSLLDLLVDVSGVNSHATQAVILLHMEKYPVDSGIALLSTLREVIRDHGKQFPLFVTADLDFYCAWRNTIRDSRCALRSVFDCVHLLPPPLPWEMGMILHDREDKRHGASVEKTENTSESATHSQSWEDLPEPILRAALLGSGIFQFTLQRLESKKPALFERSKSQPRYGRDAWPRLMEVFQSYVDSGQGYDADREDYVARCLFFYDVLYEMDQLWPMVWREESVDLSVLFDGMAVRRHEKRGLAVSKSRLLTDVFSKVLPKLVEIFDPTQMETETDIEPPSSSHRPPPVANRDNRT